MKRHPLRVKREMGFGNGDLGIWRFFERGEMKRAKIERKARRAAERHKKSTDYSQRTTDFGFKAESRVFAVNPAASEKLREEILTLSG